MKVVDLTFGFERDDLDGLKVLLENALGAVFESRDSFYHGGRYLFSETPQEELIIKVNQDLPGELAEDKFPHLKSLVLVDATQRPLFIKDFLNTAGAILIREDEYEK